MSTPADTLDKIDAKILRLLQSDGRLSNLKLAEEVHLSPTAVLERVKRLTREPDSREVALQSARRARAL